MWRTASFLSLLSFTGRTWNDSNGTKCSAIWRLESVLSENLRKANESFCLQDYNILVVRPRHLHQHFSKIKQLTWRASILLLDYTPPYYSDMYQTCHLLSNHPRAFGDKVVVARRKLETKGFKWQLLKFLTSNWIPLPLLKLRRIHGNGLSKEITTKVLRNVCTFYFLKHCVFLIFC